MQSPLSQEACTAHRYGSNIHIGATTDVEQEQQLGFRIDPLEVRLITSSDDPYTWSYMPEKAHLFQKHLSKHTMGACVELYDEVGKTFEAVRTAAAPHDIFDCQTEVDVSFTSTIKQLEQNYALLQQEHNRVVEACERWQAQATKNGQLRENMENELAAKKTDLESAYSVIRDLRRQLEKLQGQKASSVQQLDEISKMLNNIRSGLCTVAEPVTT